MKIDEKLALNYFKTDKQSHITVNQEICRTKCKMRYCLFVCPGHLYEYDEEMKEMRVEYAGCLECGTCKLACDCGALTWEYPKGDFGVQYRHG
ncbi:MAG TPA: 4Fe-4S dicluster domain-containing protein [Syntrophorhabdaceae bacterium]|nr:4Fe-4S dicluster domain-containing protein [Syntrophorhabdaceae bacterium]